MILYHGTTEANAADLLRNGFSPADRRSGANDGRAGLLYLSTDPEDARWFSNQAGEDIVLQVEVDLDVLIVDPEDGIGETVQEEVSGQLPGKLGTRKVLPAAASSYRLELLR